MTHEIETPSPAAADAIGGTARACIIDDDPLMAGLLARRLAKRGVDARVFDDGERLLAELPRVAPSVLFTDLAMPRLGGAEIVSRARGAGFAGLTVLVTAERDMDAIAKALRAGADVVLAKPPRDYDLDWIAVRARSGERAPADLAGIGEALEHVDQGAVVLDEEGLPLAVNARARQMLGVADAAGAAEAVERSGVAAAALDGRRDGISFLEPASGAGGPRHPFGIEVRDLSAGGRRLRIALLHDFSAWRRVEERNARFAAYLSHRMRTPLTSVRNAVTILCGPDSPREAAERERFLDIGCRNIEKLVSSLDELQKAFLADASDSSGCRALARPGALAEAALAEAAADGVVAGYRVRADAVTVPVSRARLGEFVRSAAAVMRSRLQAAPHVDCVIAAHDGLCEGGEAELSIVLTSRARGAVSVVSIDEYLSRYDGETGIVLDRLARALGGSLSFPERETIRLAVPLDPRYDRELDLVRPFHLVLERARLSQGSFDLVSARLAGARENDPRLAAALGDLLHASFAEADAIVSRGESAASFTVCVAGMAPEPLAETLERSRERFARLCRERGDETYPSMRWRIAYHCDAASAATEECPLIESYIP